MKFYDVIIIDSGYNCFDSNLRVDSVNLSINEENDNICHGAEIVNIILEENI